MWSVQVKGATLTWTGGAGPWDTSSSLWNPGPVAWINANSDTALFNGASGLVTLGGPITAGGLIFNSDGYSLTGGTLTLQPIAGVNYPSINVLAFDRATIGSVLAGTNGFAKTGDGTLVLTNAGNTFSGDLVINGGTLVISDPGQLGTGTTAVSINGIANTGNPGFSGGSLVVQGNVLGTGLNVSREISVTGRGPGATNSGGGLVSLGNNTFSGDLVLGSTASEGRVVATSGITTLNGSIQLGTGGGNIFLGNGNFIVSAPVLGFDTAQDRLIKTGTTIATTLWLQNNSNTFAETLRIDSGTVRVSSNGALGTNLTNIALDF